MILNWRKIIDYVVFDLEIKKTIDELPNGWEDKHLMGVSSGVAWDNLAERWLIFDDHNLAQLIERLSSAKLVVGFNHIRFDYRVLEGAVGSDADFMIDRPVIQTGAFRKDGEFFYNQEDVEKLDFDILLEIWKALGKGPVFNRDTHGYFGLDAVARQTLGLDMGKTGHGAHAPVLFQEGRLAKLMEYNLQDVKLTRDLFRFARKHGYVLTKDGPVNLDI